MHPAGFHACLVTCGHLRTPHPVHMANGEGGHMATGEGGCVCAHPFAHPVRTPHLHARAQMGHMCAHPPFSACSQQSTWEGGGAHIQGGGGGSRGGAGGACTGGGRKSE